MCGFIAQLVEHRTGIPKVTGSNPVEALIFSGFFFPIAQIGKLTAMIILHVHLHPQFKYELFHIYFTLIFLVCGGHLNVSRTMFLYRNQPKQVDLCHDKGNSKIHFCSNVIDQNGSKTATNFFHTKTAYLVCIRGQFCQLIKVNKICRSP